MTAPFAGTATSPVAHAGVPPGRPARLAGRLGVRSSLLATAVVMLSALPVLAMLAMPAMLAQTSGATSGSGIAPPVPVQGSPQPAGQLTPVPPHPPSAPLSRTRLRVDWRGGALYVYAERARLSTVLSEIARRTGVEVQGIELLHELVSVELTKVPLQEGLEKLLARDDYAIQAAHSPGHPVSLRVVIFDAPHDTAEPVADNAPPAANPAAAGLRAPDNAALQQALKDAAHRPVAENEDGGDTPESRAAAKRLEALQLVAKSGQDDHTVVSTLGHALDDDDSSVRDFAIQTLAANGTPEAMGYLRGVLRDPDPGARLAVVESIGEKEEGRAILEEALSDTDESVRAEAAALLKEKDGDSSDQK